MYAIFIRTGFLNILDTMKTIFSVMLWLGMSHMMLNAQVTTRPRPAEWNNLVRGDVL